MYLCIYICILYSIISNKLKRKKADVDIEPIKRGIICLSHGHQLSDGYEPYKYNPVNELRERGK